MQQGNKETHFMSKERTEKTYPAAAEITGLSVTIRGPKLSVPAFDKSLQLFASLPYHILCFQINLSP